MNIVPCFVRSFSANVEEELLTFGPHFAAPEVFNAVESVTPSSI